MTLRDHFKKTCIDRGMFDDDAEAATVEGLAAISSMSPNYKWRFDDETSAYPGFLLGVAGMSFDKGVRAWIEANQPMAWYKEMFA